MIINKANLTTYSIDDLRFWKEDGEQKKLTFRIPTYQRGYRWDSHVTKLLDDLYEFYYDKNKRNRDVGKYYCLQPIIVKHHSINGDEFYEVVDGQQRLTTIFILLKYLYGDNENLSFRLMFERDCIDRETGKTKIDNREYFLENINNPEITNHVERIDYYYFKNAYKLVDKWVKENVIAKRADVKSSISLTLTENTKIIWYELEDDADARSVFRNINDGKIKLTNAELIKAMLLNSRHFLLTNNKDDKGNEKNDPAIQNRIIRMEQERIARVWDEIERMLEADDFWGFIYPKKQEKETRIDYFFELYYIKHSNDRNKTMLIKENIYDYFEDLLKTETASEKQSDKSNVWEEIKEYYRTFYDWYSDIELYNYIGYLIHYKSARLEKVNELVEIYGTVPKDEFLKKIKDEIKNDISIYISTPIENPDIQETEGDLRGQKESLTEEEMKKIERVRKLKTHKYIPNRDNKKIEKTLVVFNIETLNKLMKRFDFTQKDRSDTWSVEHIFARNPEEIEQESWVAEIEGFLVLMDSAIKRAEKREKKELSELKKRMEQFVEFPENQIMEEFFDLYNDILEDLECKGADVDSIENLALIHKNDNSILTNAPFNKKRSKIIKLLEARYSVPHCTTNVFMKFYSGVGTNLDFWDANDGKAYIGHMADALSYYLD